MTITARDFQLTQNLVVDEGLRTHPYRDTVGKLTIGVGRNLDDVGLSYEECRYLLANDIREALKLALTLPYFADLTEERQRVIVEMLFQLGWSRFKSFRRMEQALVRGDYDAAAEEILDSKAARQVPRRFQSHAERMRTGENGRPGAGGETDPAGGGGR